MNYNYPNDGHIHTRGSELARCTPGQIKRVILERFAEIPSFSSSHMGLGSVRHEMFKEESLRTHRIPQVFLEVCPQYSEVEIDIIEQELVAEIAQFKIGEEWKKVILHSTPDQASTASGVIVDFKMTTQEAKKWKPSKQLLIYAYQLFLKGHTIKEIAFLIEQWNSEKTEIIKYDCSISQITQDEIQDVIFYLRDRAELLVTGIEMYQEGKL